jgi:hypothetical protein
VVGTHVYALSPRMVAKLMRSLIGLISRLSAALLGSE